MKRVLASILLILFILSFAGCKDNRPAETPPQEFGASLTGEGGSGLYTKEKISLPNVSDYVACAANGPDGVYLYCSIPGDTPKGYIAVLSPETGEMKTIDYSATDFVSRIFISPDGSINTFETRPIEGTGGLNFLVKTIGSDGTVTNELNLEFLKEHENTMVTGIVSTPKGLLISMVNSVVLVKDGKIEKSFEYRNSQKRIVQNAEGGYLICGMEADGYAVEELSFELMSVTKYTLDGEYSAAFDGLGSMGVYLADGSNLYSVNYKTGERESVVNFVANGVCVINTLFMFRDGRFFTLEGMGGAFIWSPSSVSEENVVNLKMVTFNSSMYLTEAVLDFNSQSEKYKIDLVDYAAYNTGEDLNGGLTKLNTEIITGNYPDIFYLSILPADAYAAKGGLEDLRPFIDSDADFDYDDFVGSVMDTLSDEGKLYRFVPGFSVEFLAGDASVIGDEDSWTPEKFLSLAKEVGDKSLLSDCVSQEEFIRNILSLSGEDFINRKEKTCSFDNKIFAGYLEYAASLLPKNEISAAPYEINYQIISKNQLLDLWDSRGIIGDLMRYERLYDKAVFVGFPTNKGTGYAMTPLLNFGMSSAGEHKEGAWEFFKFMLGESYQNKITDLYRVNSVLSDNLKSQIDQSIEEYTKKPIDLPIIDPSGGETMLSCDPPDRSMSDKALKIINQIDRINEVDEAIYNIVMEEATAYFQGQKGLDEVVGLIQSRLQLYVSEQG